MPRPIYKTSVQAVPSRWAGFENPSAWRRSNKGNVWREWDGVTITIFRRQDGRWGWCIADEDGPRYSTGGYETQADARTALGENRGVSGL